MHDIFVSYSHADEAWKERITVFLRCVRLRKNTGFRAWNDDDISIGDPFESRIREAIETARVAILLVSPDFMASEFVHHKELVWMRERSERGSLAVRPLLIRPSPLSLDPWLSSLQFHPDDKNALSAMEPHAIDGALTGLTNEIDRLLNGEDEAKLADQEAAAEASSVGGGTPPTPTETAATSGWSPLEEKSLYSYLHDRTGDEPLAHVRFFATKRQQTWLIATVDRIYCLLDDERTQSGDRLIQWRLDVTSLPVPVRTRPSSRYEHLGLLDVGDRQNWLYSKRLFEHPETLVSRVEELVDVARTGQSGDTAGPRVEGRRHPPQ